jgi:hypothetical protein
MHQGMSAKEFARQELERTQNEIIHKRLRMAGEGKRWLTPREKIWASKLLRTGT